jgi:hypothetical protein
MTSDEARAQMDLATESAKQQIELTRSSIENQLDACDRIILRKAADATINIAELAAADPT